MKQETIISTIQFLVLLLILIFNKPSEKKSGDQNDYLIKDYKIKELEKQVKIYDLNDQKHKRNQDSLIKLIKSTKDGTKKIEYRYISKKDSIRYLPIDMSIKFFSDNLPEEINHRR